ncbi:hypothetical protein ACHAXT_012922 [Thalassiosira profunda]
MGGGNRTAPLSEISVEMHSMRSSNASWSIATGGYRNALDSECDFDIDPEGEFEAVSEITTMSRAVDEGPEPRRASRIGLAFTCIMFIVCLLAVLLFGKGNGGIISPKATIQGDGNENSATTTVTTAGEGKVVEFTVANLNTNAQNCTHLPDTHILQCVPQHNDATNKFRIRLHPEWAPRGVERFEQLTTSDFWNDVRIFRIVPNFVSQFGISSYPSVEKSWASLGPIEDDPVVASNTRGTVSFAQTSEPNSRTTQVFINTADNKYLDNMGFAPIGEVLPASLFPSGEGHGGLEVVDEFYGGYGEEPSQTRIRNEGAAYLKDEFPFLSYFVKAEFVVEDEGDGDIFS